MTNATPAVDAATVAGEPVPAIVTVNEAPASAATVNEIVKDTATRRAARTAIQYGATILVTLLLLGSFDALFDRASAEAPLEIKGIVTGLVLITLTAAQNYAEDKGIIPPVLKTKANVRSNKL